MQFFLKGARRADMRDALKAVLAEMPEVRRRVTVDVDPLSVLVASGVLRDRRSTRTRTRSNELDRRPA